MSTPFKLKGMSFKSETSKKTYTKKDPSKSYMGDKDRSKFKLFDASREFEKFGYDNTPKSYSKHSKHSETDIKRSQTASKMVSAGTMGSIAGSMIPGGSIAGGVMGGITATGAVIAEGLRRVRKGETRAKDRPASAFSGGKTWTEAKEAGKSNIWNKKK